MRIQQIWLNIQHHVLSRPWVRLLLISRICEILPRRHFAGCKILKYSIANTTFRYIVYWQKKLRKYKSHRNREIEMDEIVRHLRIAALCVIVCFMTSDAFHVGRSADDLKLSGCCNRKDLSSKCQSYCSSYIEDMNETSNCAEHFNRIQKCRDRANQSICCQELNIASNCKAFCSDYDNRTFNNLTTHCGKAMTHRILICFLESAISDVPPTITGHRKRTHIFKSNDTVRINCEAKGKPDVTYRWTKDGSFLNTSGNYSDSNGTLVFDSVTAGDEGDYRCYATNRHGTSVSDVTRLRLARLHGESGSSSSSSDRIQHVVEGEALVLKSSGVAGGYPRPRLCWQLNGSNSSNSSSQTGSPPSRIQIDDNGDLHFAYVTLNDGLEYVPSAYSFRLKTNVVGNATFVNVTRGVGNEMTPRSPAISYSSCPQLVALRGCSASIRCIFSGYPEPSIAWDRVGNVSLPCGRYRLKRANTTLIIDRVDETDAGVYECTGSNENGTASQSFNLSVEAIPKFVDFTDGPYDVIAAVGYDVTFNCSAPAIPEAEIAWFQNGTPINETAPPARFEFSANKSSLTIRNVCRDDCTDRKSDLMVIQCNASNKHGYAFASGYLNVLNKTEIAINSSEANILVDASQDNEIYISCNTTSDSIISLGTKITWYFRKNGQTTEVKEQEISGTYSSVSADDKILAIRINANDTTAWKKHQGEYVCIGQHEYSRDEISFTINANAQVDLKLDLHYNKSDDAVRLNCSFRYVRSLGDVEVPRFRWFLNNAEISSPKTKRLTVKSSKTLDSFNSTSSFLTFAPFRTAEYGTRVRCEVYYSQLDFYISKDTLLPVPPFRPEVSLDFQKIAVLQNKAFNLTCTITNFHDRNSTGVNFTWYKGNELHSDFETSSPTSTRTWSSPASTKLNVMIACMAKTKDRSSEFQNATIDILKENDKRCPSIRNDTMIWPQTKAGDKVRQPCPKNFTGNCSRTCQTNEAWSAVDCGDCVNQQLTLIFNEIGKLADGLDVSNKTAVANTVGRLSDFTTASTGAPLTRGDLNRSLEAMTLLTKIRNTTEQTPNKDEIDSAVKIINNLLATNKSSLASVATKDSGAAAAATLMSFGEVYGQALSRSANNQDNTTTDRVVRVVTPFVVLEAESSNADELPRNFSFPSINNASNQKESRSDRITLTMNNTDLAENLTDAFLNAWSLSYKNIDAFLQNTGEERINSRVLSLSVSAIPHEKKLSSPVKIVLQHTEHSMKPEANPVRRCVFWEFGKDGREGGWSDDGCEVVSDESDANQTVCSCTHLTNFAILMSNSPDKGTELAIVSTVGCCMSTVALVLTIVYYAVTWKQTKSHQAAVLLNFCAALVVANVIFLLGADQKRLGLSEDLCTAVAVLLHYFFLAAFFMMLAEGIQLFVYVVFVFHAKRIKETALLIVTAWVLPMIIVAVTFGSVKAGAGKYREKAICWLSPDVGHKWAFGGPAFFIIGDQFIRNVDCFHKRYCIITARFALINCLIMMIVIARITFNKLSSKKTNKKQKIRGMLWNLAVLCPVLGSTWLLGIVSLNTTDLVYQYIFAIVNSLQGVFVFAFHVLFPNQKFNERLVSLFPCCRRAPDGSRSGQKPSGMQTASTTVDRNAARGGLSKELESEAKDIAKKLAFEAKAANEVRDLDPKDAADDVTSEIEATEARDGAKKLVFRAKAEFLGLDVKDVTGALTSETEAKSGDLSSEAKATDGATQSPRLTWDMRLGRNVAAMISAYEAKAKADNSSPEKHSVTFKTKDLVVEERSVADDLDLFVKTVINDVIANAKTKFNGFSFEEEALLSPQRKGHGGLAI